MLASLIGIDSLVVEAVRDPAADRLAIQFARVHAHMVGVMDMIETLFGAQLRFERGAIQRRQVRHAGIYGWVCGHCELARSGIWKLG